MLSRLVGPLVAAVVGFMMFFPIKELTSVSATQMNVSSAGNLPLAIMPVTPYLFLAAVLMIVVANIVLAIRESELIKDEVYMDEYQEKKKDNPNKKQTYEEYVHERLRIERMMKYGFFGRLFG